MARGHAELLDTLQYPSTVEVPSCDKGVHTWKRRKACCIEVVLAAPGKQPQMK